MAVSRRASLVEFGGSGGGGLEALVGNSGGGIKGVSRELGEVSVDSDSNRSSCP